MYIVGSFFLMTLCAPISALFPYTTLFRSVRGIIDWHAGLQSESIIALDSLQNRLLAEIRIVWRSEEHTSELQSLRHLVCRLLLEKNNNNEKKVNASTH